jgi:UDP-2-acetamido-3-amino-2,3-dideoxy-glucuronate N-acetyltransferase
VTTPQPSLSYFAHPTAIIDSGAKIGPGTRIWHWVHIGPCAEIGANCSLGQNVYVGKATIGNNVKVQNNVSVFDAVVLEDDVFCGPSMVFTNVINPRSHIVRKHEYKQTRVRRGASIGANAVLLCGIEVGMYSMIGAGAVVTRDVPDYCLVVGNPARRVGWTCRCGIRLEVSGVQARCQVCDSRYEVADGCCRPIL